jgi:hypothetical protein
MTEKTDATFLLALLIVTVFGLVASSMAHSAVFATVLSPL